MIDKYITDKYTNFTRTKVKPTQLRDIFIRTNLFIDKINRKKEADRHY